MSVSAAVKSTEGAAGVVRRKRLLTFMFPSPAELEESAGASLELGRLSAAADATATVAAMAAAAAGSFTPAYNNDTQGLSGVWTSGSGHAGKVLVIPRARLAAWEVSESEAAVAGVVCGGGEAAGLESPPLGWW